MSKESNEMPNRRSTPLRQTGKRFPSHRSTAQWVVGAILLAIVSLGAQPTRSSFTTASVTNSASHQTGHLEFDAAVPSSSPLLCVAKGSGTSTCAGSAFATSAASASDATVTSQFTNRTGITSPNPVQQVRILKCDPAQFSNAALATNPLLPRGRVPRQVTDPWGTTSAANFSNGQFAGSVLSVKPYDITSVSFTLGAWFKLPTNSGGGPLLNYGPTPTNAATTEPANPVIYLDPQGRPKFASRQAGNMYYLDATATFRDNRWHFMVATVQRGASSSIVTIYIDGQVVASDTNAPLLTGATDGYWAKVGWMDWPGLLGNNTSLNGSVSGVFLAQNAAPAAAVQSMYQAGSASAYAASIPSVRQLWMMGDSATSTYAGAVPWIEPASDPCAHVLASWKIGSFEVLPSATLAVQETRGWQPTNGISAGALGNATTSTTTFRRNSTYDTEVQNLELVTVAEYRYRLGANWSTALTFDRMVLLS